MKRTPLFTDEQLSMLLSEFAGPGLARGGYSEDEELRPCILQAALNSSAMGVHMEFPERDLRERAGNLELAWDEGELPNRFYSVLRACENA